ncbi:MAG TPA: glycosyltransferase [Verrucomicrobiae bacterium]|nr:glycosyltransferase [Verrucomicrobiae bacterium]
MADGASSLPRVRVDGKFFRAGEKKFCLKGVSYGPFAPHNGKESFASPEQTARDFELARELGANVLRVYDVPPRWLLDLAAQHELRLLVDIPWQKFRCFLESRIAMESARTAVREAARACAGHPAVFALSVVNEIPADVARWSGAREVTAFIEELVEIAKSEDPECLCTFANYPPTEFLRPRNVDFVCFNVYLHHRRPFENYLARLQNQADTLPLVLGEFGADSQQEGETAKSEMLAWQIEAGFRSGLAGMIVFSFTDDWFKGGHPVTGWFMGLTTRERKPKESFYAVRNAFAVAPHFPMTHHPKVSVVVACYNGARTLRPCLDSLGRLNYPDYEVILVDDGSTDATPQIASLYPDLRVIRQENHGLSVARNTGIAAAQGEIVAFTDADCRADEDWLYYLVGDLISSRFTGIGGPNFLPPEDSPVAAAVLVSPGGPAHVMLNDRVAEHIPGCNMAFYKWALEEIGRFDPIFTKAGDDVDLCWRLQQRGYRIGYNPAGFVWHYRRSTVRAYLKQQEGYGEAEAMLVRKHPEYFNSLGGGLWRGRIYTAGKFGLVLGRSVIYHGTFATGFFQTLYAAEPSWALMLLTSFEFHVLVTLPLLALSAPFHFLFPVALASLMVSLAVCVTAGWQAELPKDRQRLWSRALVALLFFLQPISRGWARYKGRLGLRPTPQAAVERLEGLSRKDSGEPLGRLHFWGDHGIDRIDWVNGLVLRLDQQGWPSKTDSGWSEYDIEIFGSRWSQLQLTTATEDFDGGKRLFRCRLRAFWSLPAKAAFWSLLGFEMLLIGVVARDEPWLWMLLLTMPIFGWFLEQEKRNLLRSIAAFVDEVARQRGLTKLKYDAERDKFEVGA